MSVRPRWLLLSIILSLAGSAVAGYLTVVAFDDALLVCGIGDCSTVQNSPYAKIGGIPIALLGLGMYLVLLALGIARWRWWQQRELLTSAAAGIALAGTLYSAYLTYLELFVIHAICQWCVTSAILVTALLLVEGWGLSRILRGDAHGVTGATLEARARRQQPAP